MNCFRLAWFDYAFIPPGLEWLDMSGNDVDSLGNYYALRENYSLKVRKIKFIFKVISFGLHYSLKVKHIKINSFRRLLQCPNVNSFVFSLGESVLMLFRITVFKSCTAAMSKITLGTNS